MVGGIDHSPIWGFIVNIDSTKSKTHIPSKFIFLGMDSGILVDKIQKDLEAGLCCSNPKEGRHERLFLNCFSLLTSHCCCFLNNARKSCTSFMEIIFPHDKFLHGKILPNFSSRFLLWKKIGIESTFGVVHSLSGDYQGFRDYFWDSGYDFASKFLGLVYTILGYMHILWIPKLQRCRSRQSDM